ncbi:MAG: DUF433 domain-containing protein [Acidobacteria bacterium]|nr:DUF433 domain-containing protein [Acidobacteriota bacterium]
MESIDWSDCFLVETKPGVQGGSPLLRGTRLPVAAIVDNVEYGVGVAEISEQFEVPIESVHAIVTYAKSHRVAHGV